jgi:Ca2+-binding EF-hand superfamily protein
MLRSSGHWYVAGVITAIRRYNTDMLDIAEALEALSETLEAPAFRDELVAALRLFGVDDADL